MSSIIEEISIETTRKEFITKSITKNPPEVISNIDGNIFHQNYLYYLQECWSKHYGVIVDPVILWHMVLCELAVDIREHQDDYRQFFTKKAEGKTEIEIYTGGQFNVDYFVEEVVKKLFELIPIPLEEQTIFPDFSTHTDISLFTHKIAFMDAASPFYNYTMLLCNIPKVRVVGYYEDWNKFLESLQQLYDLLPIERIQRYFVRVANTIKKIKNRWREQEYLKKIFYLVNCGSGSETEVEGWILDFYLKPISHKIVNYNTHVSKVDFKVKNYKISEYEENFQIYAGLFSSNLEDNFLIPQYGSVLVKKPEQEESVEDQPKSEKEFEEIPEEGVTITMPELKTKGFQFTGKRIHEPPKPIVIHSFRDLGKIDLDNISPEDKDKAAKEHIKLINEMLLSDDLK